MFGGSAFTEWVVGAQRATGRCGGADGSARLLVISAAEMRVEASVFRGVRVGDWIDQVGLRLERRSCQPRCTMYLNHFGG